MYLTEKQIAIADSLNAIVTRYGAFDLGDDANGCEYQDGEQNTPNYGKCCCECVFFRGGGCAIVNGQIEPMGVCRFWVISDHTLESDSTEVMDEEDNGKEDSQYTQDQEDQQDPLDDEMKSMLSSAERNKLPDGDFVIPEDRAFPVMDASDVKDAVSSWGRYRGKITFDVFKERLIKLAKRKNLASALPSSWSEGKKSIDDTYSIKSVGVDEDVYRGLGIVFGSVDLYGDKFTKNTYIGQERDFKGMPLYYDHSLETIPDPIGTVVGSEVDDTGVWFEFQLNRRNKYAGRIRELLKSGALGLSTGCANHLTRREKNELKSWVVTELSVTPEPAEYKTFVSTKQSEDETQNQSQAPQGSSIVLIVRGKK